MYAAGSAGGRATRGIPPPAAEATASAHSERDAYAARASPPPPAEAADRCAAATRSSCRT
eukprot:13651313-Alexandrium_andersonii.AAC.1